MSEKKINPMVKTALEMGPIIAFFAAYIWLKEKTFLIGETEYSGFIIVTAGFIPVLLASTGALWWLTGKLARMQIVTVVLVTVFGGLSVWMNDDRFFKMKPTIIYLLFAGILTFGLMRGRSYMEYVMEGLMPLRHEGWMILTKRVAIMFFMLAVLNEVIWRSMSTESWVYFKTFGLSAAVFIFFMSQTRLLTKYAPEETSKT